ncbi:cytochrome c oxidase assembly protein [Heyndrickxia sporothermodurans]|nr:cytochrome c oxidase assembly protein [Heyndrickxia sporothermodurans]
MMISQQLKWNIPFLIICVLIIGLSYFFTGKRQLNQFILFSGGMILLYLLQGSPLRTISHLTFTTHMLQISLLYFIVPQFLLLGMTTTFYQKVSHSLLKHIKIDSYFFIILFSFFLYIYHLPVVFTFITSHKIYHDLSIWILFILALLKWAPYIFSKKQQNICFEASYKKINVWLITPACLLLIMLPVQETNPLLNQMINLCIPPSINVEFFKPMIDIQLDQQIAGILMFFIHKSSFLCARSLAKLEMNKQETICIIDFFFKRRF